jgi:hypothetical protein
VGRVAICGDDDMVVALEITTEKTFAQASVCAANENHGRRHVGSDEVGLLLSATTSLLYDLLLL